MNDIELFFRAILPEDGWFYVAGMTDVGWRHRAFHVTKALEAREWAIKRWQANGQNVYFTPCTWIQPYVKTETGKNKNQRSHVYDANKHRIHALWLDIDLKDNEDWSDIKDAAKDLVAFLTDIRMPMPNVILDTGGGLHVYWVLDTELTKDEWQPLGDALKSACFMKGFKADPKCTDDSSRVLRLPATINQKYDHKPVTKILKNAGVTPVTQVQAALAVFLNTQEAEDDNAEFSSGGKYAPGRVENIVQACPLFAHLAETGGKDCSEPLWKGIIHICAHTEDGEDWAHKLSNQHHGYSVEATAQKLRQCDTKIPPTLCSTLEHDNNSPYNPCEECPHRGKIKSPAALGYAKGESVLVVPDTWPEAFFVRPSGVYTTTIEKGKEIIRRVSPMPVLNLRVHDLYEHTDKDAKVTPWLHMFWQDRKGKNLDGMIPMSCLSDYRSCANALNEVKFHITRADYRAGFDAFMSAWVNKLRESGEVAVGKPQFGWHMKDHNHAIGFAIGNVMYLPDGTEKVMMWPDTKLNHVYACVGDIDEWRKAVDLLLKRNRPEIMLILAAAFAAPLFTFLGESSAVVSVVSRESGVGKSSALKVAQAVWGNPKDGISSLNDSMLSVSKKMGILKHLPVFWDELRLTEETAVAFVNMMFQLSQGREKTRLTSNVDFRETGTWETILLCASNHHLSNYTYDPATRTNASIKRLFEYDIPYDGETPRAAKSVSTFNNLRHNYGHAGVVYAKHLVSRVAEVRKAVLETNEKLAERVGARNEDRYWIGTMTCLLLGAQYAKEAGLVDFDMRSISDFLLKIYNRMVMLEEDVVETDLASRMLGEFLRETEGASLYYNDSRPKPGKSGKEDTGVSVQRMPTDNRQGLIWEYYAVDGVVRIAKSPLRDFLKRKKLVAKDFFSELARDGYEIVEVRVALGYGTRHASVGRSYCYEITVPDAERAIVEEAAD